MDNRSSSLSKSASERPGGDGGSGIDQSPDLDRNIAVSVSSNNKNTNHNHIHVSSSSGSTNDDDRESTGPLQTGASSTGIGSVSSTSTPLKLGGSLDGPNSVSSSSNTTTFMKASTPNNSNGASSSVAYPNDTGNPSSSKKSKKEKKPRKKRKSRNEDMNDISAHDSTQSLLAGSRNNSDTMMHNNTFLSSKGSGASSSNENVSSKSGTYKNNPKNHENAQSPIKKNSSSSGFKHYELSKRDSTASNTNASSSNSRPGPKTGKSRRKERFGSNSKSSSKDGHYRRGGSSSAGNHHGPNSASSSPNNNNQRDNASTSSSKSKLHSSSQNPNNSSSNNSSTNASHRKHKKQKSSNGGNNNSSNSSSSNTFRKHKKQKTSNSGSNNSYLDPMASVSSSASVYSPEQATVNDMMRRALEEDRYSGQGSIVDTDSSEDENENDNSGANGPHLYSSVRIGGLNSGNGGNHLSQSGSSGANSNTHSSNASNIQNHHFSRNEHLDRTTIMNAMKKRLRVIRTGGSNKLKSSRDFLDSSYSTSKGDNHHSQCRFVPSNNNSEYNIKGDLDDGGVNGTNSNSGGRKKKKKKGKRGGVSSKQTMNADNRSLDKNYNSDNDEYMMNQSVDAGMNDRSSSNGNRDRNVEDHINEEEEFEEEGSIFGQTAGSTNATWVECDKCGKWRRLRGVVDAKKLPLKWYCSMNKNDPERARCSAPEEAYDTPESATDHRARKHLRLWVRRLQSNEAYEARLPTMTRGKKRSNASSAKEPYEWVRCCSPSCGKWRAILKFMDANSVIERAKNGEWYCVLNTWDEKFASCAAPQENLPAIGCPPWVIQDEES